MARFNDQNLATALEIVARYPVAKSATIPLLHLAQEQDGYVAADAMEHIAELIGTTPAEVLGTCSFYEMFKREPVGDYVVNVCTNISCNLCGGEDVLQAFLEATGTEAGAISEDGRFTVMEVECLGACGFPTIVQINDKYYENVTAGDVPAILETLK